jgi:hypothetical protein
MQHVHQGICLIQRSQDSSEGARKRRSRDAGELIFQDDVTAMNYQFFSKFVLLISCLGTLTLVFKDNMSLRRNHGLSAVPVQEPVQV